LLQRLIADVSRLVYSVALHVSAAVTQVLVQRVLQLFEIFSLQELFCDQFVAFELMIEVQVVESVSQAIGRAKLGYAVAGQADLVLTDVQVFQGFLKKHLPGRGFVTVEVNVVFETIDDSGVDNLLGVEQLLKELFRLLSAAARDYFREQVSGALVVGELHDGLLVNGCLMQDLT
jgi:hypothetical protein